MYVVLTYIGVTAVFSSPPGGIGEVKLKKKTIHVVIKHTLFNP